MKKFQFKLDGVLKVREFKEKKVKIELGELLREISEVEDKIAQANQAISEAYLAQEKMMADPTKGQMIQFFPIFIQGKKDDIKNKETLLWSLKKKYDKKLQELAQARGEVKIMENFKEKKKEEWKKDKDKREQESIEEILMMRSNGSKGIM